MGAYISDTGAGGLIVYDQKTDSSWRFEGDSTKAKPGFSTTILGEAFDFGGGGGFPSDGIALTPDLCRLYYCPLSSDHMYSLPTGILLNRNLTNGQRNKHVTDHGVRPGGFSDGLAFDENGVLYLGGISDSALYAWDPAHEP